jgi:hypothetical protein
VERAKLLVFMEEPTNGYKSLELSNLRIGVMVMRSFTEKPKGSNSMEHHLSQVNVCTEIRLKIRVGV